MHPFCAATPISTMICVTCQFETTRSARIGRGRGAVGKCTGPKWSKVVQRTILVKMTLFRTGFLHSRDQNGPKWSFLVHFGPKEVFFGPFRSANRTLATPERRQSIFQQTKVHPYPLRTAHCCVALVRFGWGLSNGNNSCVWAIHPVRLGLSGRNSRNFRKDPGNDLRAFPGIPLESTAGIPQAL